MEKNIKEKISNYARMSEMKNRALNCKSNNLKSTSGITLVALVVTIIVLLILAGVSLSAVFSQDGIFRKAEQATDKHGQAKARETLELALGEAQMQKYEEGLTDEQLDNKIGAIQGELLPKEKPEYPNLQNVIVDGYIFEIDRSVPKIVDYIGPADGVIITAVITQNGNWQSPVATLSGTIKTYSGGNITTVSATKDATAITGFSIDAEGKYTINNITSDTTIVINAKDSNDKENTKTIPITIRIDTTPPTISEVTATALGLKISINARAIDSESGVNNIKYSITPTTGIPEGQAEGSLTSGEEKEITSTEVNEEYTITFTAEDNAGNKSTSQSKKAKTGIIKHINTTAGLKAINACNIYGADVTGYNCGRSDVQWQIFYIDEEDNNRVYLIAKDFMGPPTTGTELTKSTDAPYQKSYYWSDAVLNKYTETIPNTTFTQKFLSDYAGTSASELANLQATNYMLDQSVWSEYMSINNKSDYAFGGPTLQLFQASYNDICKTATKLSIRISERRPEQGYTGSGYQVKSVTGEWEQLTNLNQNADVQKDMYFKGSEDEPAWAMWICSPSYNWKSSLVTSFSYEGEGWMSFAYCYKDGLFSNEVECFGFRPIISLKSNAQFTDNGNGTYTIVN